jgi:hypothetical protein
MRGNEETKSRGGIWGLLLSDLNLLEIYADRGKLVDVA